MGARIKCDQVGLSLLAHSLLETLEMRLPNLAYRLPILLGLTHAAVALWDSDVSFSS